MNRAGRKHNFEGYLTTDAGGLVVDQALLAHIHLEEPAATDADGIAVLTQVVAASSVTAGLANPDVPRALSIVSNKSNGAGNVKIYGTNYADEAIDETLALNGVTPRDGAKAFKTVTKVDLPAQVNAPELQVETATAAGTVTTTGNAAVTVTSALFAEDVVVAVPVVENDDAAAIALAIRTALAANAEITAHFTVSGADAAVILTAKAAAANDTTLNIAIDDGEGEGASAGVTTAATSANTTPGVAPDVVTVGWNDKLGLPYLLGHNTILAVYLDNTKEANAATVTVSATAIESNTIDLHSALDGSAVDIYLIV